MFGVFRLPTGFFGVNRGGLLAAALFSGPLLTCAQAPAWQLAEATTQASGAASLVQATAADAAGNVYVAGSFTDVATFGGIMLTSAGSTDVFVAKWNTATGRFVWAVRAGGAGGETAAALAVQGNRVYVAGSLLGPSAAFGPTTLANTSPSGGADAFVAQLTDGGSSAGFGWATRFGGPRDDQALALAATAAGVYVAGSFQGTLPVGTATLVAAGSSRDAFVARLDDTGPGSRVAWAVQLGSAEDDAANALAVVGPNIYTTGYFGGTSATFGAVSLPNTGGPGTTDAFVAKLVDASTSAAFGWATRLGGSRNENAYALAVSGSSVYAAGSFDSPGAIAGPFALPNADATATPNPDAFVTKLTDAGSSASFGWATAAGGLGTDEAQALAVRGAAVYVGGYFDGATAAFGPTTLVAPGNFRNEEIFVARLTDGGSNAAFSWATRAGGTGDDRAFGLALTGPSVYVGGFVTPSANFGPVIIATPTGTPVGVLAALPDTPLATAAPLAAGRLELLPNPAHGRATLRLPTPAAAPQPLTLTDALGREVRRQTLPARTTEAPLDLAGLAPGLYFVRVGASAGKLVVE